MAPARGVWVTRAEPGATATAARLRALGWRPLAASLLEVRAIAPDGGLGDHDALAFTSANGVRAFARLTSERSRPVWAVGETTAEAARAAGFRHVQASGGDVAALAAAIAADRPGGILLHPRGREAAGDLAGALAREGMRARDLVVYETLAADVLPREAARALGAGEIEAVLLHSPKAARTLARLLDGAGIAVGGVRALGLSAACVAPLEGLGFAERRAAPAPAEAALLKLLAP